MNKTPILSQSDIERFERSWVQVDQCWEWQLHKMHRGYGLFSVRRKQYRAHKIAYFIHAGIWPEWPDTIDHLCCNKACVNPAHMEVVPVGENNSRKHRALTHCRQGHPYSDSKGRRVNGMRVCVACKARTYKAWVERRESSD